MTRSYLGYVSSQTTDTVAVDIPYGVATGGSSSSITVSSQNYTLLTFTSDGTLTVSKAGLFDVLLIGGGGGAAAGDYYTRVGGGGGGGDINGLDTVLTVYLAAGTYTADVGAGGAGSTSRGTSGAVSSLAGLRAIGGGGAGGYSSMPDALYNYLRTNTAEGYSDTAGGSGAGVPMAHGYGRGLGTKGNNGGSNTVIGFTELSSSAGGGGGGAGSAGGSIAGGSTGGAGGNGADISGWITGATYYASAGGGGGGTGAGGAAGNGGVAGRADGVVGNNGVNYGAGGGGARGSTQGGSGAAGAVFVRFKV
jgi:hypothetical protein